MVVVCWLDAEMKLSPVWKFDMHEVTVALLLIAHCDCDVIVVVVAVVIVVVSV